MTIWALPKGNHNLRVLAGRITYNRTAIFTTYPPPPPVWDPESQDHFKGVGCELFALLLVTTTSFQNAPITSW